MISIDQGFRAVGWLLVIVFPCFFVMILVTPIWGLTFPDSEEIKTIRKIEPEGFLIKISGALHVSHGHNIEQASYISVPGVFSQPDAIAYIKVGEEEAQVRRNRNGAWGSPIGLTIMFLLSWFYSKPRLQKLMKKTPNQSPQPTAVNRRG